VKNENIRSSLRILDSSNEPKRMQIANKLRMKPQNKLTKSSGNLPFFDKAKGQNTTLANFQNDIYKEDKHSYDGDILSDLMKLISKHRNSKQRFKININDKSDIILSIG
jgi:hypothetical protein